MVLVNWLLFTLPSTDETLLQQGEILVVATFLLRKTF